MDGRMLLKADVTASETDNTPLEQGVRIASRTPACIRSGTRLPVKRAAQQEGCVRALRRLVGILGGIDRGPGGEEVEGVGGR
jgi:hypothetical protein